MHKYPSNGCNKLRLLLKFLCDFVFFQIRIDFSNFVITGPNTITVSNGYEVGGSSATLAGKKISSATQCQTDTFSLTGPAGSVPPVICGTNTGEHSNNTTFVITHLKFQFVFKPFGSHYYRV